MNTKTETMNETTTADVTPTADTTSSTNDNAGRLADLATKIRTVYAERQKCDGKVEDWKMKQLKAGIELGEHLLRAKSLAPKKKFTAWCRDNFPELHQRTLNRYMIIARNKDKTHVSKAKGLREAQQGCSTSRHESDSSDETGFSKDSSVIKKHLTEANDLLQKHPNFISSAEADAICELVNTLNVWVTDYRDRTSRHALNIQRDSEFETLTADEKKASMPSEDAGFVTTA